MRKQQGDPHASVRRHHRHRDQHLLAHAHEPRRRQGLRRPAPRPPPRRPPAYAPRAASRGTHAEDLLDIVLKTLRGKAKPVMSLYDCRQIQSYPTTLPLMRAFVDRMKAMEGKDGILSISIGHCFPYADVPEIGGRILVVMDKDKAKGDALATRIGEEFVSLRGKTMPEYLSTEDGISTALAFNDMPVVMADPADNAGGGAPSDNTTILRRLIEREAQEAVLVPLWDPIAVRLCFDAGLGAEFPLRFGGKIGPTSGAPIDAKVTVIGLKRDCCQSFGPTQVPLGDCAAIRVGGVEIVL